MTLSEMQLIAIMTEHGFKCPHCGKYRRLSDFDKQAGHIPIGDGKRITGHVHVGPACRYCWDEVEK